MLFPPSTAVIPFLSHVFVSFLKKLQPRCLPTGRADTVNVRVRGCGRFVTGSGFFETGSFKSMPRTCKTQSKHEVKTGELNAKQFCFI